MDIIGNLLTSIRNAEAVNHPQTVVPFSKHRVAVLTVLKKSGYITDFEEAEVDGKKRIKIGLKQGASRPTTYKRISTPGRRLYTPARDIPMVLRGLGIVIVSTSKGVMTGKEARKQNLGGELICEVS